MKADFRGPFRVCQRRDSRVVRSARLRRIFGSEPLDDFAVLEREAVDAVVVSHLLAVLLERDVEADRAVHVVTAGREIARFEARELGRFGDRLKKQGDLLLFRRVDVPWQELPLAHDAEVPKVFGDVLHDPGHIASAERRVDLLHDLDIAVRHVSLVGSGSTGCRAAPLAFRPDESRAASAAIIAHGIAWSRSTMRSMRWRNSTSARAGSSKCGSSRD